uniref:Alpha/beta-tubulin-N-acetyltransferase 9 n=1 Tax=Oryctolagus cuniculus TaxID=9986 RepID=A0A5F9CXR6_RABIT
MSPAISKRRVVLRSGRRRLQLPKTKRQTSAFGGTPGWGSPADRRPTSVLRSRALSASGETSASRLRTALCTAGCPPGLGLQIIPGTPKSPGLTHPRVLWGGVPALIPACGRALATSPGRSLTQLLAPEPPLFQRGLRSAPRHSPQGPPRSNLPLSSRAPLRASRSPAPPGGAPSQAPHSRAPRPPTTPAARSAPGRRLRPLSCSRRQLSRTSPHSAHAPARAPTCPAHSPGGVQPADWPPLRGGTGIGASGPPSAWRKWAGALRRACGQGGRPAGQRGWFGRGGAALAGVGCESGSSGTRWLEDPGGYHEWMQSEELQRLTASEPLSLEQEYAMQHSWREDGDKCTFIVLDKERWQAQPGAPEESCMAGDVNLFLTDPGDPTLGEIEVMIAEPSCRGKGLGTEAVLAMLSYGVTKLGLTKFEAKIGQGNEPSLKLFRKLHFEPVAVSSVFQEVTLRLTMSACERQWLLEQTSHVQERPYREESAEPH